MLQNLGLMVEALGWAVLQTSQIMNLAGFKPWISDGPNAGQPLSRCESITSLAMRLLGRNPPVDINRSGMR